MSFADDMHKILTSSTSCNLESPLESKPPPFPILQTNSPACSDRTCTGTSHRHTVVQVSERDIQETKQGLSLLFAASLLRSTPPKDLSTKDQTPDTTKALTPILSPQPRDVLAGRGGAINQHWGNRMYRRIVEHNKPIYRQVPKRQRQLVSQSIVQVILDHGGRFLEKKNNHHSSTWTDIGFQRAVQKTSQALREPDNTAIRGPPSEVSLKIPEKLSSSSSCSELDPAISPSEM
ncbi:hypothetical protein FisN_15Lh090 [Fistulifera solaris]|uniref:DUF6824 domain-containing protein n=1 Tax=Fistulifera solaris TaxID=1519565 RepID=A0A1Z5KAU7_FISSO|nr:hypothetical protein FisN_15Lh090 [Fistulifera solaris]|eukprot:GAX23374.1 hypothetical protein FisN_15Lh090 [Fistulifera solaris]